MCGRSRRTRASGSPCTSARSPTPTTSGRGSGCGRPTAPPRATPPAWQPRRSSTTSSRRSRARISCWSRASTAASTATGTYRLTMTHTPGPITVSPGDQGGPLTNGATHTGEILQGDVDVWTFTATAGERIAVHIGEITDTDDFRPWIRLWAPNGATSGDTSGLDAAVIDDVVAPVTGTYLVLVASFDSGFDGAGTYRLTMTHTPGPITVIAGRSGRPADQRRDCTRARSCKATWTLDVHRDRRRADRRAHRRDHRHRRLPAVDSAVGAQRRHPGRHVGSRRGGDRRRGRAGHRHLSGAGRELRQRRRRRRHVSPDDDAHAGPDHRVAGRSGRAADQWRHACRRDPAGRPGRVDVHGDCGRADRGARRRDHGHRRFPAVAPAVGAQRRHRGRHLRRGRGGHRRRWSRRSRARISCWWRASTAASTAKARIA